jgi:hypothetical protein
MNRPGKTSWRARLSALAQQMPASRRRQRWTLIARLARQSNLGPPRPRDLAEDSEDP